MWNAWVSGGGVWLLCRKEYTYTGLKHKKVNVQIQKNTSQAIPTTVARDCTIEMGQNSNVQQASYIILPIFWISLVLLMQFLPHTFLHVVIPVVRMSAMSQPVLHNTLHSTLKTRFPQFECDMCFQNNPTSAQSHRSLRLKTKQNCKCLNKNLKKTTKNATQNFVKQSSWVSSYNHVYYSSERWKSLYRINWPLVFCLLLSVCYVTSWLPGERLSNTSARPTIGGNHHFRSYFRYIFNNFLCSFS